MAKINKFISLKTINRLINRAEKALMTSYIIKFFYIFPSLF